MNNNQYISLIMTSAQRTHSSSLQQTHCHDRSRGKMGSWGQLITPLLSEKPSVVSRADSQGSLECTWTLSGTAIWGAPQSHPSNPAHTVCNLHGMPTCTQQMLVKHAPLPCTPTPEEVHGLPWTHPAPTTAPWTWRAR